MLNYKELIKEKNKTIIATDFDGTISDITINPAEAEINKESKILLTDLSKFYNTVAVISGRPVKKLNRLVDIKNIEYVGNHGAEILSQDLYIVNSSALRVSKTIKDLNKKLIYLEKDSYILENKEFSLSIHFRNHKNPTQAEQKLLRIINKYITPILKIQKGKKVLDICPKNINKGDAIEYLYANKDINNFLYFGDDKTDIDAFIKMDDLKEKGLNIYKFAVVGNESPRELLENCDYDLKSIEELNNVFRNLIPQ